MTSDVSARRVVCDAGPTKARRKWKKGVIPYVLPSTSVSNLTTSDKKYCEELVALLLLILHQFA